ncbi:MAG: hypothetical protein RR248_01175 [Clostridia bacterium]
MKYVELVFQFLTNYKIFMYLFSFCLCLIFLVVNRIFNAYRQDLIKLKKADKVLGKQEDFNTFAVTLPLVYQYQLQYFLHSKVKASQAIVFVTHKKRTLFALLPTISTLVCMIYAVLSVYCVKDAMPNMLSSVCLALTLIVFAQSLARRHLVYEGKTNTELQTLLIKMDLILDKDALKEDKVQLNHITEKIKFLIDRGVPEQIADKISQVLQQDLVSDRTVASQRKLNCALNSLLCYVSKQDKQLN